jgi:hypothetical protein
MRWMADTHIREWRDLGFQAARPPQQPGPVTTVTGPHVCARGVEGLPCGGVAP